MTLAPELARIIERGAVPSRWAREVLHFEADPKQIALLDSEALDSFVVWSRQTGKTETAAAIVSHFAVHNDATLTLLTSATQRQAGIMQARTQTHLRMATGELAEWQRGQEYEVEEEDYFGNVHLVRVSVMSLQLSNGSQVVAVPPSPDSARGYSPHFIVIDEAARTRPSLWHAISPMRAARRVRLLAMSTAWTQAGWFYDLWKDDPDVQRSEYQAKDCPRITAEFLAKERRRLPSHIYAAEYENVWFPPAGRLFTPEMISSMMDDTITPMFEHPTMVTDEYTWRNANE